METSEQVWRDALGSAIEEVFDTMVLRDFVEEPGLDVPAILGDKACVMTVELFGSSWARIVLRIRSELARDVGSNILGVDEAEMSEDDVEDAACELLNMIAGACKRRLADAGSSYELGVPGPFGESDVAESNDGDARSSIVIAGRLGDDPLEVRVFSTWS